MSRSLLLKACSILAAALAPALAAATREEIIARMDKSAPKFHQMAADVKRTTHTAVLDDYSVESGSLRMRRTPAGEIQGLVEFTAPDHKLYLFEKQKLQIYTPAINTIQVFDLGQHGEELDRFLSIGFGTSGKELAQGYDVEVPADNKIPRTTKVRLTPKDAEVKKYLTRIDLWITDEDYPIQERLVEPSGDTILVNYSSIQINPALKDDAFRLPTNPKTKTEYPQR